MCSLDEAIPHYIAHLYKVFHAWHVFIKFVCVEKQIKHVHKQIKQEKLDLLNDELQLAINRNDSAGGWRTARHIAAAVKGSRRNFMHTPMPQLYIEQALIKYKAKTHEGGWGAEVLNQEYVENLEPDFTNLSICVEMNTENLYGKFVKSIHYAKNRKFIPPGEIPSELWRVLLEPQWLKPFYEPKWGLGNDKKFEESIHFTSMTKALLSTIWFTNCLPINSVFNLACVILKKVKSQLDPNDVGSVTRSIHCYNAFTQGLLKALKKDAKVPKAKDFCFGAVRGRRREEAIALHMHTLQRANHHKLSCSLKMYDVINAFYCAPFENYTPW